MLNRVDAEHLRRFDIFENVVHKERVARIDIQQFQRQTIDGRVGFAHAKFTAHHHKVKAAQLGDVRIEPAYVRLVGVADDRNKEIRAALKFQSIGERGFVSAYALVEGGEKRTCIGCRPGKRAEMGMECFGAHAPRREVTLQVMQECADGFGRTLAVAAYGGQAGYRLCVLIANEDAAQVKENRLHRDADMRALCGEIRVFTMANCRNVQPRVSYHRAARLGNCRGFRAVGARTAAARNARCVRSLRFSKPRNPTHERVNSRVPVFALSLILIALVGPLMAALKPHRYRHSGWLAALVPAVVFGWLLLQAPAIAAGNALSESHGWVPELGLDVSFRLDGLSLLFALIVTGVGAGIAVYTGYYFEDDKRLAYFNVLLFLFMASMLGLVLSDNLLGLFSFWEGTSITSYLLIAFKTTSRSAREGGRRAFIVTGLGGLAMLAGMILLGTAAGTYSISGIVAAGQGGALLGHPYITPALILVMLGAFTKSAQFPFHFWLPGAMSAPTPASAYLHSATMVKAGIFLLARLHPAFHSAPLWSPTLITVGAITMLLGAVSALRYSDMKALLAYATVSWLGVLTMLLGVPVTYAPMAVAMGVLAHALYKGPLFLAAGIVDHATGTRDLRRLSALMRPLPWVAAVVFIAGLSMAGVPPLLGFVAKELLLESAHKLGEVYGAAGEWTALVAIVIVAALTVAVALKLAWEPFVRSENALPPQSDEALAPLHVHHKPRFAFVLPALMIASLGALLPFFLEPLGKYVLLPAANSIAGSDTGVELAIWHGFNLVFTVSMVALALGLGFFLLRHAFYGGINRAPAWLSGLAAFNRTNQAIVDFARWLTRRVQGGTMASQISVTLLAAASVAALALVRTESVRDQQLSFGTLPSIPEVVLAIMAMIAAVVTVRARNRLGAIISLGVVGVTVTLYFIFFSAPDLALTQLLIELLTVVLLVLVFFRLKSDRLPPAPRRVMAYQIFVAVAMGVFGFTLVLLNAVIQVAPSISDYYERFSVPYGNGGNIVNVILVDFRGFDTLGEMTVLAIAAIGGFALLRAPRMAAVQRRLLRRLSRSAPPAESSDTTPVAVAAAAEQERAAL